MSQTFCQSHLCASLYLLGCFNVWEKHKCTWFRLNERNLLVHRIQGTWSARDTPQALECCQDSLSIGLALLCVSSVFFLHRLTSHITKHVTAGILQAFQGWARERRGTPDHLPWSLGAAWLRCFLHLRPRKGGQLCSIHRWAGRGAGISQECGASWGRQFHRIH